MTKRFDPLASLVYLPPDAGLDGYQALAINELEIGKGWARDAKAAKAYARLFRTLFANRLLERHVFRAVLLDPGPEFTPYESGRVLRMEGKVTVFSLGNGWKRYFSFWCPFLQGGATDFQIEARFRDAVTGEVVMEFADRRRHLGNTAWGPNMRTFSGEFVMKHTVQLTARSLADFIAEGPVGESLPPKAVAPAQPAGEGTNEVARGPGAAQTNGGRATRVPEAPLLGKGGSTARVPEAPLLGKGAGAGQGAAQTKGGRATRAPQAPLLAKGGSTARATAAE
ncbi:MAG: hypothetical protein QGH74_06790 [Candidatus Brocadiia bacterium]|nr:hypothetical protein [Candidatus Brocadiia bacterium]